MLCHSTPQEPKVQLCSLGNPAHRDATLLEPSALLSEWGWMDTFLRKFPLGAQPCAT